MAGEQDNGWLRSTRCESAGCIEVRLDEPVLIRDSKIDGPVLQFTGQAWVDFVEFVKTDGFTSQ